MSANNDRDLDTLLELGDRIVKMATAGGATVAECMLRSGAELSARVRLGEAELVEEAGLAADHFEHLVSFHNSPGFCDESVGVYLATGLHVAPHDPQGIEEQHMTIERMPLDDALAMIGDGRITDAKTIIGLTLTAGRRAG